MWALVESVSSSLFKGRTLQLSVLLPGNEAARSMKGLFCAGSLIRKGMSIQIYQRRLSHFLPGCLWAFSLLF